MAQQGSGDPQKVYDMIKDVRVAMMTTIDADGALHSRPMHTMKPDAEGDLWFFTRRSAPKTAEVEREHAVNLAYADPGSQNYVSVSGRATIVTDAGSGFAKVSLKFGSSEIAMPLSMERRRLVPTSTSIMSMNFAGV